MLDKIHNIPADMREYTHWIVWRYVDRHDGKKPTKVPYNANEQGFADVTDPSTWATFDVAVVTAKAGGYDGIGFVLSDDDPYVIIDLDGTDSKGDPIPEESMQKQIRLEAAFDSYSERSPSGKGLHIITKGKLWAGRRREFVEVYPSERYMTMTGDVFRNKNVEHRQELLSILFDEMAPKTQVQHFDNMPQTRDDADILSIAAAAANGEKFWELHTGNWLKYYQSQSEADFAYVDILGFWTQNREQITRMFRASALGQRDKAQRDNYVNYMLAKCFDRMPPPIDVDAIKQQIKMAVDSENNAETSIPSGSEDMALDETPSQMPTQVELDSIYTPPPGLVGEIAKYIYEAAVRPVPEIAIAAALGLMAGITGRAYNISGTGLNQYILLLAETGNGKEGMASGIDKLLKATQYQAPEGSQVIGPAEIASGQALLKYLSHGSKCFVTLAGEFSDRLKAISSSRASNHELMLCRVLLDLYNKSGKDKVLRPSIYSDKDKTIEAIDSPSFSILAESQVSRFYRVADENMIANGLLPRFTIIEYNGDRPPLNRNHIHAVPSDKLCQSLSGLITNCHMLQEHNKVVDVGYTKEAEEYLDDLDTKATGKINNSESDVIRQLWNRAHIKALKLAAMIAVGNNCYVPVIDLEIAKWARRLVESDVSKIVKRFEDGRVGENVLEREQFDALLHAIGMYITRPYSKMAAYRTDRQMHRDKIIPMSYVQRRLGCLKCFKDDRMGATGALRRAMLSLVDTGELGNMPVNQLNDIYGFTGKAFIVKEPEFIIDKMNEIIRNK